MTRRHLIGTCAVGLTCAAVGAGAGVLDTASGAASPTAKAGAGGPLRRAVHAEAVVPVAGGGFATATLDRGVITGVSGSDLTVREGTKKAAYKSVTLSIPAAARIRLDRKPAQLSQLAAGDRVLVFHGPKRTRVAAFDARARTP